MSRTLEAASTAPPDSPDPSNMLANTRRVDVVLGVMSRCPDALYFETLFSRAVERINPKMRLTLSYIGQEDPKAKYGVACKHGDLECAGNIHQLCVADALDGKTAGERWDLSPSAAQRKWWDFVSCQDFEGGLKSIGTESLVKQCLEVTQGPKWEKDGIEECVKGRNGTSLLLDSVRASQRLGIEKSATLQIEGQTVCIRDDAQWKDCPGGHEPADWVRQIEEAWDRINNDTLSTMTQIDGGQYLAPRPVVTASAQIPTGLLFQKRQASSTEPPPPQSTGNNGGGLLGIGGGSDRQTPLSIFTFIVAIALFVLVVLFVLLRIYIRNRRLRALGLFPEGPIERFLGAAATREIEDPLVPPRLWEAKIVDVHRAAKTAPEPARGQGWDALMPISAALPPSFYPLAAEELEKAAAARAAAQAAEQRRENTYPPPRNPQAPAAWSFGRGGAARAQSRHMRPRFLRRNRSGNAEEGMELGGAPNASGQPPAASTEMGDATPTTDHTPPDQRLPTSVNVTVLIAMPSERTVFPSTRKPTHAISQASNAFTAPEAVTEDDEDRTMSSDDKGKARRAPSLRSVRSRASLKSVGEARREAFFGAEAQNEAQDMLDATNYDEDDEDEELPELVFGTASVPVFARVPGTSSSAQNTSRAGFLSAPASELVHPEKRQLVELMTAAIEARERRAREAAAAAKAEEAKKRSEEASGGSGAAAAAAPVGGAGGSRTAGASSSSVGEGASPLGGLATGAPDSTYERPSLAGDTTSPSMDVLRPQTEASNPGGPALPGLASDPVTRLSTHSAALRELAEREARGERQGRGGTPAPQGRPTPREIIAAGGLINGAGHGGM